MPIIASTPIQCLSQDEYHAIDRVLVGHAFKIHNQYGGLLDEAVYKTLLTERCTQNGIPAKREVMVQATHGTFAKSYFIDLLLGGSTIVEVKTARVLTLAHRGQGINYLLLAGTRHGSLINFRGAKTEREFLSTTLSPSDRRQFDLRMVNWPDDALHSELLHHVRSLCSDFGLGLETTLYREALATLLNLPQVAVAIMSATTVAGHHEMSLLSAETALVITSRPRLNDYRRHLIRLLSHTTLNGMTWINLALGQIHLEYLSKSQFR